ncbi:hypothetical protein BJ085DRAFT_40301 [Dimargaris cristalligena]|uniref:DUS-like FMN-binding domain-containing protein n=1 Tax=Dimargaris cristalligena TaxID=215637 RepID=A0A4P9ZQ84_9FUNG|nr:hypothetical protein BJ085DRAFT_40301 [Dimargaris cristalligena]|eukprot:RKP35634.1 hypothetical protein BJ085DRAFT_40301 [Dimargaris cristalligena]
MSTSPSPFPDKQSEWYADKLILAPMVRIGTLPMRMLALKYGADIVYTPEIIAQKIITAERIVNPNTGIIEYITKGAVDLAIHPAEKPYLVFQMGASDPDIALKAALAVAQDVSGIDLNCGCPKKFSIQGGMGAALLTEPEKLEAILRNLVEHCPVPVTCKIRVLDSDEDTIKLVKMIESTGVKALAVHCRTRDQRPRDPAHWDKLKLVTNTVQSIPIIANGDVFKYADISKIKEAGNVSSVMIARGAQSDPSIFSKDGPVSPYLIAQQYISLSIKTNNRFVNAKYLLMQMYPLTKSAEFKQLTRSKNYEDLKSTFGLKNILTVRIDKLGEMGPDSSESASPANQGSYLDNFQPRTY